MESIYKIKHVFLPISIFLCLYSVMLMTQWKASLCWFGVNKNPIHFLTT